MKINGITSNMQMNLYKMKNKKEVENKNKIMSKDKVEISQLGKSLSEFSIQDEFIPDKKNVDSIKEKINQGKYDISSKDIAESLLKTMISRREK